MLTQSTMTTIDWNCLVSHQLMSSNHLERCKFRDGKVFERLKTVKIYYSGYLRVVATFRVTANKLYHNYSDTVRLTRDQRTGEKHFNSIGYTLVIDLASPEERVYPVALPRQTISGLTFS